MATVTANIVVQFAAEEGAEAGSGLFAEIDAREDGLNNGDTQFRPGDPVHYLVFKTSDVTIDQHLVSAGVKAGAGSGNLLVEEYLAFTNEREKTLPKPITSGLAITKLGTSFDAQGVAKAITASQANELTIRLSEPGTGIWKVSYQSAYTAHKLSGVPANIDRVLIFLSGEGTGT